MLVSGWDIKAEICRFMSTISPEVIQSSIIAFEQLWHCIVQGIQGWSANPAMINSDVTEKTFCQPKGKFNGSNTNPTALHCRRNINGLYRRAKNFRNMRDSHTIIN